MNSTPLLLVPLASLALLTASPTPPVEADADLDTFLAQLDAAPEVPADSVAGKVVFQGLTTGGLQSAAGLHSGARGLTPDEDWQRLFPRYAKRR